MWEYAKWLVTLLVQFSRLLVKGVLVLVSTPEPRARGRYHVGLDTENIFVSEPSPRSTDTTPSERRGGELCSYCKNVIKKWAKVIRGRQAKFSHCNNIFALERSAKAGCSLCAQFLDDKDSDALSEHRAIQANALADDALITSDITVKHSSNEKDQPWRLVLEFHIDAEKVPDEISFPSSQFSVLLFPSRKKDLNNEKRIKFISTEDGLPCSKHWLEDCTRSHKCYQKPRRMAPHRLLHIQPGKVKLHLTSEVPYQYATLSHCWGSAKTLKLTTGTFGTFLEGIPWDHLSKTFQDAINVALSFGLQYIWIDSLCIRQDDARDWQVESAEMCNIYQGSFVNIAASGAVDGTIGCFFERDETWECRISVGDNNGISTNYLCVPQHIYDIRLTNMPLMKRGWVLQEWLLAPRTLFFTTKELFWMCGVYTACETFPSGLPERISKESRSAKPQIKRSSWERIVEEYSRCQLTFKTDKLVAISGIAQCIGRETGSSYIVGIWKKDFESQLCWHMADKRTLKGDERPHPWRAPSWSWASTDNEAMLPTRPRLSMSHLYVKKRDVEVKLDGRDPFGGALSASLNLGAASLIYTNIDIKGMYEKSNFTLAGKSVDCWVNMDYSCEILERFCIMPVIRYYGQQCYIDALVLRPVDMVKAPVGDTEEKERNPGNSMKQGGATTDTNAERVYAKPTDEAEERWIKRGTNRKIRSKQQKVIEATDIADDSADEPEEGPQYATPVFTAASSTEDLSGSLQDETKLSSTIPAKRLSVARRSHSARYQRVGHMRIEGVQACHDFNKLIKSAEAKEELYQYTAEFGKVGRWTEYNIDLI
ncbi:hypothetical protein GLAREA_02065 [Glarea lozoyensis ATCC 20868]|uniref:Heterokaryon incompatibility domain-containing protein n=1 Tax=Glarea lozoyensis (strain ATCC 20868 / MF5171) TaxID=1116229 RepID=S3DHV4_GLAL2|nr:uncharacterized protein GLAREA_02065 [Glarea lozoyensis ATCC 20868]EPE26153.1 hypothetical protein GLAREA_02065 [Glarea lozoyensis ATCC 20868]